MLDDNYCVEIKSTFLVVVQVWLIIQVKTIHFIYIISFTKKKNVFVMKTLYMNGIIYDKHAVEGSNNILSNLYCKIIN